MTDSTTVIACDRLPHIPRDWDSDICFIEHSEGGVIVKGVLRVSTAQHLRESGRELEAKRLAMKLAGRFRSEAKGNKVALSLEGVTGEFGLRFDRRGGLVVISDWQGFPADFVNDAKRGMERVINETCRRLSAVAGADIDLVYADASCVRFEEQLAFPTHH